MTTSRANPATRLSTKKIITTAAAPAKRRPLSVDGGAAGAELVIG
jgi:hypothetical protein